MHKHSTSYLIPLYIGSGPFSNDTDEQLSNDVRDELVGRGVIKVTPLGTQWLLQRLSHEELVGLEDDMRGMFETVGMFREQLDLFLKGKPMFTYQSPSKKEQSAATNG